MSAICARHPDYCKKLGIVGQQQQQQKQQRNYPIIRQATFKPIRKKKSLFSRRHITELKRHKEFDLPDDNTNGQIPAEDGDPNAGGDGTIPAAEPAPPTNTG